jgi:hypothetical protein
LDPSQALAVSTPPSQPQSMKTSNNISLSHSVAQSLPYVSKFLLVSSFLCHINAKDDDAKIFTTKVGKRRSTRFNSLEVEPEQVTSIKSFQLERLLTIVTIIISNHGREDDPNDNKEFAEGLGHEVFFSAITELQGLGLITAVKEGDIGNPRYKCAVTKELATEVAESLNVPLETLIA